MFPSKADPVTWNTGPWEFRDCFSISHYVPCKSVPRVLSYQGIMFPGYNVPRILSNQGPISPGSQVSKALYSQRSCVFQLNTLLTHINPPCVRVRSLTLRTRASVSFDHTRSLKPHIYLLLGVQPRDESFGVDELQPKVPSLTQADRPGNLRHRRKSGDMSTSTFTITFTITTSSSFIFTAQSRTMQRLCVSI